MALPGIVKPVNLLQTDKKQASGQNVITHRPSAMHSRESTFPLNSSLWLSLPSGVRNVGGLSLLDLAANKKIIYVKIMNMCF